MEAEDQQKQTNTVSEMKTEKACNLISIFAIDFPLTPNHRQRMEMEIWEWKLDGIVKSELVFYLAEWDLIQHSDATG